jgi:hypothetical protein
VLFGTGIGIWERERAFRLPVEGISPLLAMLDPFFFRREAYGDQDEADSPLTVTCSVMLAIGGEGRRVVQMERGEQSAELRDLAHAILDVARELGAEGAAVSSLGEGLDRVARGSLPPEVVTLVANRQPEAELRAGWLLRLAGRRLTTRVVRPEGAGYGDSMARMLTDAEIAALTAVLVETAVWDLPGNLPVAGYTDLQVTVLGRTKEIQARPFSGRAPMPEEAARFERIRRSLEELHRRVQETGGRDPD